MHHPVVLRHTHRTWLNSKGQVVSALPGETTEPRTVSIKWEARVLDAATEQPIEGFPTLSGTDTLEQHAHHESALEELYYERLRWVDGDKPDIEQLKQNVNAGIWTLDIQMEDPTLLNPVPVMND
jgi:hypothetical protein